MIPKRIFYVWGFNEPQNAGVKFCINSWKQNLSDYEIIEINESSIEYFNFKEELKNNEWFKCVYDRKMFAFVADYIRIKVLYENGGIYLDTDVSVVKDFGKILNEPMFVGIQDSSKDGHDDIVEPAVMGAQKGNEFLKEILSFYDRNSEINVWNSKLSIMPEIFKNKLEKIYGKQFYPIKSKQEIIKYKDITIYPEKYFIPFRCSQRFDTKCIDKDTYTIHWFGGSWTQSHIRFFLEHKHSMPLEKIDKITKVIKAKKAEKHNTFLQNIFSIKNSNDKLYKIITIFGIKTKIQRFR